MQYHKPGGRLRTSHPTWTVGVLLVLGACGFSGQGEDTPPLDGPSSNDGADGAVELDAAPGVAPVKLRTAGNFVVLAKASISGTGATVVGNLGLSPAATSYVTGFALIEDISTAFWTSAQITGRVFAADNGGRTPADLLVAITDMQLAYADAAGRTPQITDLAGGNLGGLTIAPGVYHWTGGVTIPMDVTLAGGANDVWIFQIGGTLGMTASMRVHLVGGAVPAHVFWQLPGAVTLGAAAHLEGVVLTATAITSGAGTTVKGRLMSQTDVTITNSTID